MRKTFKIFVIAVVWTLAASVPILAQGYQGDRSSLIDALRTELERTDQLIDRAKDAVRASHAPVAQLNLKAAVDLQSKAWRAFDNDYPRLAHRLTMQARDKAKRAIAAGRMIEQSEHVVLNKLERVNEMLERARELLAGRADAGYQAIFRSAQDSHSKAWEFYRSQQYRPAIKLADQAEKALRKLLRNIEGDVRGQMTFDRRAEAAEQLLQRTRTLAADCASVHASELVDQATTAWRRGRELADSGNYQAALRALHQARKLANQATRECRGEDGLRHRFERIKNEADRLDEAIAPSDGQARRFIRQTQEQLELAEEALDKGRTESAAAALKAAELTMNQLKRYLDAGAP